MAISPLPIPIPYVDGFVLTTPLHTKENGYRCRNEGCPCHDDDERIVQAIDRAFANLERLEERYRETFGPIPPITERPPGGYR